VNRKRLNGKTFPGALKDLWLLLRHGTIFIEKEGGFVQGDELPGIASLFVANYSVIFYGQRHENNIDNCKSSK
jgi:hypothetical protein